MAEKRQAEDNEWQEWWDARVSAIESVLGESDNMVWHASIPFQLGGTADVICFKKHVSGVVSVTSELIGDDGQFENELGNYELMICEPNGQEWGTNLISQLARYTLEAELHPGDTMDIGSATPSGSTIATLLFFDYGRFEVRGRKAGLLLCMGITKDELGACRDGKREDVEAALKKKGVFPFTNLLRKSSLK